MRQVRSIVVKMTGKEQQYVNKEHNSVLNYWKHKTGIFSSMYCFNHGFRLLKILSIQAAQIPS